ncbi:OmpA family protein [Bradyrhizobium sp. 2TAF36]|uniref:OmpA family protein n=1 Tax=Bradyrhizobium sp. 2TAF36 TaxID=3233016 RepID=UPI003F8F16BB
MAQQFINIPGLKGPIGVALSVLVGVGRKERFEDFPDDETPMDSSLTVPTQFWDYLRGLPAGHADTLLSVQAMLYFPSLDGKGARDGKNMYQQHVRADFPFIFQNDEVRFLVTEKLLQGEPFNRAAQQRSPFRFIEGKAWLSATNDPRYVAVKTSMVLGSADVLVESWETTKEDATWKVGVSKESAAGIIDKIIKWIPKPTVERESGKTTDTRGGTRTVGDLAQKREWTMLLNLPEQKPKPESVIYNESYKHPVYFDTNKREVGNYHEPKNKMDQIKDLMRVMDAQILKYGAENITGIEVVGHASRLGDTEPNITLSEGRAKYVADLLKRLYKVKIPDENIKFRGEPVDEGNDKDNSWKDRVVWVTIKAVRKTPYPTR